MTRNPVGQVEELVAPQTPDRQRDAVQEHERRPRPAPLDDVELAAVVAETCGHAAVEVRDTSWRTSAGSGSSRRAGRAPAAPGAPSGLCATADPPPPTAGDRRRARALTRLAAMATRRAQAESSVAAGDAGADAAHDLVGDGAEPLGPLVGA